MSKTNQNDLKKELDTDVHTIPLADLCERLKTDALNGITQEEADRRLKENGPNILTPPKQRNIFLRFLDNFKDGFSIMLTAGSIMCFIAYGIAITNDPETPKDNLFLGVVLLAVVLLTGIIGFYQNNKSTKIMDSFKKMIPQESLVIRNKDKIALPASDVVIGDLVLLKPGDFIPADLRVVESNGIKVDNSSLTGESEPQRRYPECTNENPLETSNFLIAYTYVVEGTGSGIVVFTGDNTIMGRIAFLTTSLATGKTPIAIEIGRFIKIITAIAVTLGVLFFILAIAVAKIGFISSVVFLIGIIVANVPEGLIMTVTLSLSLTAQKMAKKKCLVKNLQSVETLGSTSVICSDKTGTLTQNQMLVSHIWCNNETLTIIQDEFTKRDYKEPFNLVHKSICLCAAVCNRADFRINQDSSIPVTGLKTNGDASESALIKYIESSIYHIKDVRNNYPKLYEIPFNSTNKYQVSIHQIPNESKLILFMKGAPERIADLCSTMLFENNQVPMTNELKLSISNANEELANQGERVLGFAQFYLPEDKFYQGCKFEIDDKITFELNNLCFLGLISLIDPPRSSVPEAVNECRKAGIRVVMVTGDHPSTAKAIAKSVGIIKKDAETVDDISKRLNIPIEKVEINKATAVVISGSQLKTMSDEDLSSIILLYEDIVFARTSPQQKLIIVEGFQRQGYIVAVTGDGVNDSPALRRADIGVAMGIAGSDVAKQAADMILLDDNFTSIVIGVREGRLIFDNLKKSIAYTLTSNIPEILPFLLNIMIGIPLPLGTITILLIDLGTDMAPAISLAYETAEKDIMERKPRNPKKDRLVNQILINYSYLLVGIWQAINGMLTYLFIMMHNGFYWDTLRAGSAWSDRTIPFIVDSFGQQWSYVARKDLEYTTHSAYFFATVIIQIADLLISKTRRQSIFKQGLLNNPMMLLAILLEVGLACLLIYTPPINNAISTRFVNPVYLIIAIINAFILWIVDELRRFIMRRYPGGFIERETYY